MSLQSHLSKAAISMLPRTAHLLRLIDHKDANNLRFVIERNIMNTFISLEDMTKEQLDDFDDEQFNFIKSRVEP